MTSSRPDHEIGNGYTKVENESMWDLRKAWAQLIFGLHTFEGDEPLGLPVSRPATGQTGGWGWSSAKVSLDGWAVWSTDKDVIEWWPRVDHDYLHSGAVSHLCAEAEGSLLIIPAGTTISSSQLARLCSSVSCLIVRDTAGNLFSTSGGTPGLSDPDGARRVEAMPLPLLSALVSAIGVVQGRTSLPPYIFETLVVVVITFLLKPLVVVAIYRVDSVSGVAGGSAWFRPWVPLAVVVVAISALGVVVADEELDWSPIVFEVLGGLIFLSGVAAGWGDRNLGIRLKAMFFRYPCRFATACCRFTMLAVGLLSCYFMPFSTFIFFVAKVYLSCINNFDQDDDTINKILGVIVMGALGVEGYVTKILGGYELPIWGHWLAIVRLVAVVPAALVVVVFGLVLVFLGVISVFVPTLLAATWAVGDRWRSPRAATVGGCHRVNTDSPFRFMATLGDGPGISEVSRPGDVGSLKLWGGKVVQKDS